MPNKICDVCKRKVLIQQARWKELDSGPFVCSKDCVFKWIKSNKWTGSSKGATRIIPERANASWSNKLWKFFRSDYEKYFAEEALLRKLFYEYEGYLFLLAGHVIYIPDFYFPGYDCFVEIKGLWGVSAKGKVKRLRKEFPNIPLLVVPWLLHEEFYPPEVLDTLLNTFQEFLGRAIKIK